MKTRLLCILSLLLSSFVGLSKEGGSESPISLYERSHAAGKVGDVQKLALLYHPRELERFKKAVQVAFTSDSDEPLFANLRAIMAPLEKDDLEGKSAEELLAKFQQKLIEARGGKEVIAQLQPEVLGVIKESDVLSHVVVRPMKEIARSRPEPTSMEKVGSQWYLLFNSQLNLLITEILGEKKEVEAFYQALGFVKDGDISQVLVRSCVAGNIVQVRCYPVRAGDEAWEFLSNETLPELIEAMKRKWGL